MADTDKLANVGRQFVVRLLADETKSARAVAVAKRVHCVLRKKEGEARADVLAAASDTLLSEFAASRDRDWDVVQAALDLSWTTSHVEGLVNRIKTIKRSRSGRAGFQLLRAHVLHAA